MKVEIPPAFYAMATGGAWRDYVNLLHMPYTLWHLSYVVLGAAIAPTFHVDRLLVTLLAFFLAVGIGAHALDELNGRPMGTRISRPVLLGLGFVPLSGAIALGAAAGITDDVWILPFVAFGGFTVVAYNLGLWNDRFHSDYWFAFAWGAFPALTSYWINHPHVTIELVLVATGCFLISLAQRTLSTPVRAIRRRNLIVAGTIGMADSRGMTDGRIEELDGSKMISAPEKALSLMSLGMVVFATGFIAFRA